MRADDARHGTGAGYDAGCRDTCCRAAAAAYEYRRRIDGILGRRYTVPSLGTARRMQALVALGWTFRELGEALGCSHDGSRKLAFQTDTYVRTTTADKVAEVYERMCMTLPPQETGRDKWRAQYARTTALRNGWVPPLAWDDIDRDPAPTTTGPERARKFGIDQAAVERLLDGDTTIEATADEKREAMRRWVAAGRSAVSLCHIHGWNDGRYAPKGGQAA